MLERTAFASDLGLIIYLKSIPDAVWRLDPGLVIASGSGAWHLERQPEPAEFGAFCNGHHSALAEALGLQLRRSPSDSSFRYLFVRVDVTALVTANRV